MISSIIKIITSMTLILAPQDSGIFSSIKQNDYNSLKKSIMRPKELYSVNSEGLSPLDYAIRIKNEKAVNMIWKKWNRPEVFYPDKVPATLYREKDMKTGAGIITSLSESMIYMGKCTLRNNRFLLKVKKGNLTSWIDSDSISFTKKNLTDKINLTGKWSYTLNSFTEGFIFRQNGTFSEIGPDGGEGRWNLLGNTVILDYDYMVFPEKQKKNQRKRYRIKLRLELLPEISGKKRIKLNNAVFYLNN